MRHGIKKWIISTGIIFLFLILCPPYLNAQKAKSLVKVTEAATKRLPVKPVIGWPIIPLGISHPQLQPTNSGTLLGTPARQVIKFDPKSVNLHLRPNIDFTHDKLEYKPNFPNLRPQSRPNEPTFTPQKEKHDWFDQMIKDLDLKDILDNFYFDEWEKEVVDLYYAIIIEKYGRAITDAA